MMLQRSPLLFYEQCGSLCAHIVTSAVGVKGKKTNGRKNSKSKPTYLTHTQKYV